MTFVYCFVVIKKADTRLYSGNYISFGLPRDCVNSSKQRSISVQVHPIISDLSKPLVRVLNLPQITPLPPGV